MQVAVEIPYVFFQGLFYTVIVYAMMSFQWTAAKFIWFFFISFFSFLYFTYYGMMTVSISPNHQVAAIFAATFYSVFNLFSGFFIPRPVSSASFTMIPMLFTSCYHKSKLMTILTIYFRCLIAENSEVVDLVLLDLPIGMDSLRADSYTIRRSGGYNQGSWAARPDNQILRQGSLWIRY